MVIPHTHRRSRERLADQVTVQGLKRQSVAKTSGSRPDKTKKIDKGVVSANKPMVAG